MICYDNITIKSGETLVALTEKKNPKKHEHRYHLQQQAALAVKTFIFPGYIKEDSSYIIEMTVTCWDLIPDAP